MPELVATDQIARAILVLRGQRVLQDSELAALHGVSTKRFNEQVRRNRKRFPVDFMFQLTAEETSSLRSAAASIANTCRTSSPNTARSWPPRFSTARMQSR